MKVARGRLLHLGIQIKLASRDGDRQPLQLAITRSKFDAIKQTPAAAEGGIAVISCLALDSNYRVGLMAASTFQLFLVLPKRIFATGYRV